MTNPFDENPLRNTGVTPAQARRRFFLDLAGILLLLALPGIPFVADNAFLFSWALIWGIVGLSVNVLTGYAGQMSLAQAALMGTGAFTLGILTTTNGVPFWIAFPLSGIAAAAITVVIGLPALRIRGLNLAIVTLGFQFLMNRVVFRQDVLTGGAAGIDIERPVWFGDKILDANSEFLYIVVVTLIVIWAIDRRLVGSIAGRAFYAIREDEQVAASFGIPVARYKLLAFAIAGFYAGLGGALFSTLQRSAGAELYDYTPSLELLVYGVIGGLGSRAGVFIGSIFPIFFRQVFSGLRLWSTVLGGFLLVLTLTRYRGGLAEQGRHIAHVVSHLLKKRRGEHVAESETRAVDEIEGRLGEIKSAPIENRRPARRREGPLLELTGVSKRFGGIQALADVNLKVEEGQIVGLMGPNGAGKTTLFNCVSGFYRPEEGTLTFDGENVTNAAPHVRAQRGMGRTFQNIGLVKSETVLNNLIIAQHTQARYGAMEGILHLEPVKREEIRIREVAVSTLDRLGLSDVAGDTVHDLPHGLLKVVELGAALVTGPSLLMLDEPSSGMAPPEAEKLGATLKQIRDAFDVTILMIEHHVPLVMQTADYVYVLNFGQMLAEGLPAEVKSNPVVVSAYLGGDELESV